MCLCECVCAWKWSWEMWTNILEKGRLLQFAPNKLVSFQWTMQKRKVSLSFNRKTRNHTVRSSEDLRNNPIQYSYCINFEFKCKSPVENGRLAPIITLSRCNYRMPNAAEQSMKERKNQISWSKLITVKTDTFLKQSEHGALIFPFASAWMQLHA